MHTLENLKNRKKYQIFNLHNHCQISLHKRREKQTHSFFCFTINNDKVEFEQHVTLCGATIPMLTHFQLTSSLTCKSTH